MTHQTRSDYLEPEEIARLVDRFYEKVRHDALLGPVFNPVIADWDEHKVLMTSFWCSVALGAGTYRGNPMAAHRPLGATLEHFERWLALWRETTGEELNTWAADAMRNFAERIGHSLKLGLGLNPAAKSFGMPLVR